MRTFISCLLCCIVIFSKANDGVFLVNGNHLVPSQETDVAIVREVLTITLCDDDTARVDVLYELENRQEAKTVDVGFVANAPQGGDEGNFMHHPYIKDFTVVMNDKQLPVHYFVTATENETPDFQPLDMRQWMGYTEQVKEREHNDLIEYVGTEILYSLDGDSVVNYAYAYCFKAHFEKGPNVIHHTYKYVMSNSQSSIFEVPYTLTPAMRWANRQIDDFTLHIRVEGTAKHFLIDRGSFAPAPFRVVKGIGKHRTIPAEKYDSTESYEEIALRNGTIEWHCKNFYTDKNMRILSADALEYSHDEHLLGTFYDRTIGIRTWVDFDQQKVITDGIDPQRIRRNLPYAHRGYVFRDKQLQAYFNKLFWYMPDPDWKASTEDFTPAERDLIKKK